MDTKFDYIVVGQGLAGSAVAFQLLKRNKKILVFDEPQQNNSSRIAAGLFNPITGKKLIRTWMADQLFPYLQEFYREVEEVTQAKFFFPMPLYRPFLSVEEQNDWMSKSASPEFEPYIEKIFLAPAFRSVNDPFGGILLKQSGYLDTRTYIESVRRLIGQRALFKEECFDDKKVSFEDNSVQYGPFHSGKIIFCQGTHLSTWFSWLPIRPLKGETISVTMDVDAKVIFNRGVYAVPFNIVANEWRVGGTYGFHDHSATCTSAARIELEDKLRELMQITFSWKTQAWGVRPTTPDRRPMLGRHPDYDQVSILNGLGTKGVSLSPYFSEVLIRSIENGFAIDKAVDIERYKSLYWSSPK